MLRLCYRGYTTRTVSREVEQLLLVFQFHSVNLKFGLKITQHASRYLKHAKNISATEASLR